MVNGARQGYDYLASAEFWRTVLDFVYRAPPANLAIRSALDDLLVLLAWSDRQRGGVARGAAGNGANRVTPMNLCDMFRHNGETRLHGRRRRVCPTAFAAIRPLPRSADKGSATLGAGDRRSRIVSCGRDTAPALADLRALESRRAIRRAALGRSPICISSFRPHCRSALVSPTSCAIGQADLPPSAASCRCGTPDVRCSRRYEFEDPAFARARRAGSEQGNRAPAAAPDDRPILRCAVAERVRAAWDRRRKAAELLLTSGNGSRSAAAS